MRKKKLKFETKLKSKESAIYTIYTSYTNKISNKLYEAPQKSTQKQLLWTPNWKTFFPTGIRPAKFYSPNTFQTPQPTSAFCNVYEIINKCLQY